MDTVWEGSTITLELKFRDKKGNLVIPKETTYTVYDEQLSDQIIETDSLSITFSTYNLIIDNFFATSNRGNTTVRKVVVNYTYENTDHRDEFGVGVFEFILKRP